MIRTDLNSECNNLELIIDNLMTGKEVCEIGDTRYTLDDVIEYLRGFLQELRELNVEILKQGNSPELLKIVHNKYTELWLFQLNYTIDSLPVVIGGLLRYPN